MRNPDYFPSPYTFDPTRFLDDQGKFVQNPKVVPFGLGKRRCLGETLARVELYMFFTALLSRFNLVKANEEDQLSDEPIMGSTQSPKPYKMRFVSRQ